MRTSAARPRSCTGRCTAEVHTAEADRLEATLALDEAKLLASEALEGRSPPSDTEEGVPHVPPGIYHSSTPIG